MIFFQILLDFSQNFVFEIAPGFDGVILGDEVAVAVVPMVSPVYGALVLVSKNIVVGDPVKLYHPVVVANVVCVPPAPLRRVVPV